ncbi:MAG TPA: Asp-tRNA(Asn)/Glu-tRNA(Gln) amidotransferase subunit GatB [Verrucomicrobiota bacterium]|nr:Asp-tRNA(Asn)/Glu-tRNA(Gln) amidotransferase subunit GatB [Verrucomicrobiota bacterium]HNU49958.1 Asp-tRNA(Asn)/Glu-tRNA(Gln) amidotransferase subunit GatB [Verrucomicrobiota bacterium]
MEYEGVIGLETHVQLKTRSKMWCGCANEFGAPPNTRVCPVCLGLPGVLPVANDEALQLTVLTGLLLECEIPPAAQFDRKNYFYPDMPKNYQITQYASPSTRSGHLDFEYDGALCRVRITRAHLEEDVGKSFHFAHHSGVDFNRAGVPLLEIVSEPDITSPGMAYAYLSALKDLLVHAGISDCDMEKGMVRCDVNVSVRPRSTAALGAKIEIKNMNSFSGVRRALEFEIPRQIAILEAGGQLVQETRRWDEPSGTTEPMRSKEDAHDYRYFPDPDLMVFQPGPAWLDAVRRRKVETPLARKRRFMADYQLPEADARTFVDDLPLGDYFAALAPQCPHPKTLANWIINNLRAHLAQHASTLADLKFPPDAWLELVALIQSGRLSSRLAQEVFAEMAATGHRPAAIVARRGLDQLSDAAALERLCEEAIAANPRSVADYRAGKAAALNFLKGQVMKLSKGKANPALVGEILARRASDQTKSPGP